MADPLDDFRNVLYLVWKQILGKEPTPCQYDLAHWLQHGPRRQINEGFRGIGKSWITSCFVADCLRKDPSLNILVVSASKQRADDFSTFTLRLIDEIELFQFLRPREGQRCSKLAFDVGPAPASHAPSVKSVGVLGQKTGSRADIIVADDVESSNNADTQAARDKLAENVKEFDAILKPSKESRVIYLGTPQTEQSLYNQLPQRGYVKRIWPARFPTGDVNLIYGDALTPFIRDQILANPKLAGQPTDPKRFGELDLVEREMSFGRSGFALQFMLDTRLSDADRYPLKLSDLVVMDLDTDVAPEKVVWARSPELERKELPNVGFNGDRYYRPMKVEGNFVPYQGSVLFIDPAGRGKDRTAFAVVKMLNSQLFVPALSGVIGGYSEHALQTLANVAKEHKVNLVLFEANFGDGMFGQLLKPFLGRTWPCTIEEVKHHSVQKEKRIIDTLEPVMNQHKLIVAAKVIEQDARPCGELSVEHALKHQAMYQLSRITRDRGALAHDDCVDALAGGVNYWGEQMARNVDQAMKDRQEQNLDLELRRFIDGATGSKTADQNTWLAQGLRARN